MLQFCDLYHCKTSDDEFPSGGGLPVGAYGGRRDIMQLVAPAGPMYQAGTLSGNPLAMAAGNHLVNSLIS